MHMQCRASRCTCWFRVSASLCSGGAPDGLHMEAPSLQESKIYQEEGITSEGLVYKSNDATIELLCGRNSIFSLLEDQCLAPGGSDAKLARGIAAMIKASEFAESRRKAAPC